MKKFSSCLIATLLCLLSNARATEMPTEQDILHSLSVLEKECGYKLRGTIERSITSVQTSKFNDHHYFQINMKINLLKKNVEARMFFRCRFPAYDGISPFPLSPTEVINSNDSSGRYSSHVKWERAFDAVNWKGRIAYVDSMFGDGQKMPVFELLICPTTHNSPCPNFEVTDDTRLNAKEVNTVVRLLETIAYVPAKSESILGREAECIP